MIGNYYSKLTCWNQSTDYNQMPPTIYIIRMVLVMQLPEQYSLQLIGKKKIS